MKRVVYIMLIVAVVAGMLPIAFLSLPTEASPGDQERTGVVLPPGGSWTASELAEAIVTPSTAGLLIEASKGGAEHQFEVYSYETPLQGFPTSETSYVIISTGLAAGIAGQATTFYSYSVGGLSSPPYSHRNHLSYDIAFLSLELYIPPDATTLSFDWRFGTEENPTYTSSHRDWASAIVTTSTGSTNILLLPGGDPVDAYNASLFSNPVTGSSSWPGPPYPSPDDVIYNAVTDMYTAVFDVSPYIGETITIDFWVGDENDSILDSALFIDNLIIARPWVVEPRIVSVTPDYGGNAGMVTLKIKGMGFSEGTAAKLARAGYPDIVGTGTIIVGTTLITTTLDLAGAELGAWDLVVLLPEGTELKVEDMFTVLLGGEPVIYIDVTGRDQIRVGQTGTYFVRIYNRGTIDSGAVVADVDVDEALKVMRVETTNGLILWDRESIGAGIEEGQVLFPEMWEGAPEGIVDDFLNKLLLWIPNIECGGSVGFRVTAYAKMPWAEDDPITIAGVAVALGTMVGLEFLSNLIAQSTYVVLDPVEEEDVLSAIWKALTLSFDETTKDLLSWWTWAQEGIVNFIEIIVLHPGQFINFLTSHGVSFWKAGDITTQLYSGLQKAGITAEKLPYLKAILWGLTTGIDVHDKIKKAADKYSAPMSAIEKPITPVWSWDPNDKAGPTGYGPQAFVPDVEVMTYTIYFENLESATAPAEQIVITDTLDTDLDWSTLSIVDTSHPSVMSWTFDPAVGTVTWTFTDINLPPNKVPPEGEGWVTYQIKPKSNLPSGTEIRNKASIVFDVNPPIDTPEVLNTIDSSPPQSAVLPLAPTQSSTSFEVSWSGNDDASGVKDYTVWFSDNGGPFVIWLPCVTSTYATFIGESGHTYDFYSIAHDTVGNTEAAPGQPDATTTIIYVNQPPVADAGPDQTVEQTSYEGAEVALDASGSYDPDGDALTYQWTWPSGTASGVSPTVVLPPGPTTVTLIVSDGELSDIDTVTITVEDTTPPVVTVEFPAANSALQDGVILKANASDLSGVAAVYFYVREPNGAQGNVIGPSFENLLATLNSSTGRWEYNFDTLALPEGNYFVLAKGVDTYDNEGWSACVPFSIRNWAIITLLPSTRNSKAGRTIPIKFALRVSASVDPAQPFVWNDELTIKIFATANPGVILQASTFGSGSRDYRIDNDTLYITNFQTSKVRTQYTVEIWRTGKNFMVGNFTFATVG